MARALSPPHTHTRAHTHARTPAHAHTHTHTHTHTTSYLHPPAHTNPHTRPHPPTHPPTTHTHARAPGSSGSPGGAGQPPARSGSVRGPTVQQWGAKGARMRVCVCLCLCLCVYCVKQGKGLWRAATMHTHGVPGRPSQLQTACSFTAAPPQGTKVLGCHKFRAHMAISVTPAGA